MAVAVLGSFATARADEIDGAFGKTFGAIFDPKEAVSHTATTSGEALYAFRPSNPYSGLGQYFVLITPVTQRIYEIWATSSFEEMAACEAEFDKVVRILQKKYPRVEMQEPIFTLGEARVLTIGETTVGVRCDLGFPNTTLYVQYVHSGLREEAKQEAADAAAKGDDVTGF